MGISLILDFAFLIVIPRRKWSNIFKLLRKLYFEPRILSLAIFCPCLAPEILSYLEFYPTATCSVLCAPRG